MGRPLTDEEFERRPFCLGRVRALYGRRGVPPQWYRAGWLCDKCGVFAEDRETDAARDRQARSIMEELRELARQS